MRIYLTGPITGHNDSEIRSWRELAAGHLCQFGEVIDPALSPYDAKRAFEGVEDDEEAIIRLRHGLFVVHRNKDLIRSCDLLFANFLGSSGAVSIGSVGEIYWADAFGKPVIIVRESEGNIHDHAMLNAVASRVCYSLEEGFQAAAQIAMTKVSSQRTA